LKQRNPQDALNSYNKAIQFDPDDSTAYNNRGAAYQTMGDLDRAISDYSTAISLDARNATAYANRGMAFNTRADFGLGGVVASAGGGQTVTTGYWGASDTRQQAIADLTEAIRLNPNSAKAYYNRALAYQQRGQTVEAQRDFDRTSQLSGGAY
jgi:Flp pilus assembly protein TadD